MYHYTPLRISLACYNIKAQAEKFKPKFYNFTYVPCIEF